MQILCFFLFKGSSKCGFSTLLSFSGFIMCFLFASCIFIWTNKDDDDDDDDDTDVRIIVFPYKYIVLITHNFANSQHLLIGTNIPILIIEMTDCLQKFSFSAAVDVLRILDDISLATCPSLCRPGFYIDGDWWVTEAQRWQLVATYS